jgi:hypothetical protein
MSHFYPNDQLYIAEQFMFSDNHTLQLSQLAYHKINSLKLSAINAAFCYNRDELYDLVKKSLFNFVMPDEVLYTEGFFDNERVN